MLASDAVSSRTEDGAEYFLQPVGSMWKSTIYSGEKICDDASIRTGQVLPY